MSNSCANLKRITFCRQNVGGEFSCILLGRDRVHVIVVDTLAEVAKESLNSYTFFLPLILKIENFIQKKKQKPSKKIQMMNCYQKI